MKKTILLKSLLLLCALIVGSSYGWADTKTLTFDLTSNPGGWPTTNSTTLTNYTYTLNAVKYTFALSNVKCNSGYLMLTKTAVLGLPAIADYKLTKVVASNSSGCSTSTKVGISSSSSSASYITGGATKTWSSTSSSYTYTLTSTSANTMYYLYVTSANAQIIELELTYESVALAYTITAQSNNNEWGTVSLTSSVITASPESGYRVKAGAEGYTVTSGTATVTNNGDNTFTVSPTSDCTVRINFEAIPTHEVTFYYGGTSATNDVAEGADIVFPSPSATFAGKTFMGWTDTPIVDPQHSAPSYVSSAVMDNSDLTFYAVYADEAEDTDNITLTNSTIKSNVDGGGKGSYGSYNIDGWTGRYLVQKSGSVYFLQLGYNTDSSKSAYNSHLTTPTCTGNIKSITIETNNNTASGRTFYLCSAGNIGAADAEDATYGSGSTPAANGSVTIDVSGNTTQFHIYPDGIAYIKSITLTYETTSYDNYCTTVTSPITPAKEYTTYVTPYAMDFTEVSNLTAYVATSKSGSNVVMTPVEKVPANIPLLLKRASASTFNVPVIASASDVAKNYLKVAPVGGKTFTGEETDKYILYDGTFYLVSAGTLAAGKVYLDLEGVVGAHTLDIIFEESGEATGIATVETKTSVENNKFYNLNGQQVAQPTKGLYIVNGKKVVIK